eukprot:TRINITY_DN8587_c0_g1_i1.p1 TRINITY_DN8587_c0_g1~~TRINITY_DN8587_c0_g1_i1.p1  ORF type:complete len:232 (-),score=48.85 TRINITY_DN8587_c0_g1_i1:110-805(-)
MNPAANRWVHGSIVGPIIAPGLFLIGLTGVTYRWSRKVFGFEKEAVNWILETHHGGNLSWIHEEAFLFYSGIHSFALLTLAFTGYFMIRNFPWRAGFLWKRPSFGREMHQKLASLLLFTLSLTALTGIVFLWCRDVLKASKESIKWLMVIHQGKIFPGFELVYTAFNGIGLMLLVSSGMWMWIQRTLIKFGWMKTPGRTRQQKARVVEADMEESNAQNIPLTESESSEPQT